MFETYKDNFNQRGAAYHKAMADYIILMFGLDLATPER